MRSEKPIAIIGAGIAGLTAANLLHQKNKPFVLYEAGKKIAGLAASFKDEEGFSYDFGAHFITNRLAEAIGVGADCLTVKHYGENKPGSAFADRLFCNATDVEHRGGHVAENDRGTAPETDEGQSDRSCYNYFVRSGDWE